MNLQNWKDLLQERNLLSAMLASPQGRLSMEEGLSLVGQDASRLDVLIRQGWLLLLEGVLQPGISLLALRLLSPNFSSAQALCILAGQEVLQLATATDREQEVDRRRQLGQELFRRMADLRSLIYFVEAYLPLNAEEELRQTTAATWQQWARHLQAVNIRSAFYPEWEPLQQALVGELSAAARRLSQGSAPSDPAHLRRMTVIDGLARGETALHSSLSRLVAEGQVLALHSQLSVVVHPDWPGRLPETQASRPPAWEVSQLHGANFSDWEDRWRESGLDLFRFVQYECQEANLGEGPVLDRFRRMLQEAGERVNWQKDPTGAYWEVWPAV